jgi:hypothetical protein
VSGPLDNVHHRTNDIEWMLYGRGHWTVCFRKRKGNPALEGRVRKRVVTLA